MLMKLMTGAAFAAAVLAGAAPAKAQSFQSVVETYYNDEFRAHRSLQQTLACMITMPRSMI